MRMCTCVGVYACACARVWECMHAVLSGATRYWWSTCMHTGVGCMHAHVHVCGSVCMRMCTCVGVYACCAEWGDEILVEHLHAYGSGVYACACARVWGCMHACAEWGDEILVEHLHACGSGVYACACACVWGCMHAVLSGATRYWWSTFARLGSGPGLGSGSGSGSPQG